MPAVSDEIHDGERKIVEYIDRRDRRIELDRIEQDGFLLDQHDVRQMQVAVATPHISLSAALLQQSANAGKCVERRFPEIIDVIRGEAGGRSERRVIASDKGRDRFDPGFGRHRWRDGVGGRDLLGDGVNETAFRLAGFRQMIDGLALVETSHFNRIFNRRTVSADAQRSIVSLRDGDDTTVDLRREPVVDVHLLMAGSFPLRQCRVIEIWKADGALDLQRPGAFQKNRRRMRIDAMDMRMGFGVRQKRKDAFLGKGVGGQ